jgi:hypothetical protein
MKPRAKAKIAEGSLLTFDDQARLYREQLGDDAADRQIRMARKSKGQCTCYGGGKKVKFDWNRTGRKTQRVIHEPWCPRRKPWMQEAEELVRSARGSALPWTDADAPFVEG